MQMLFMHLISRYVEDFLFKEGNSLLVLITCLILEIYYWYKICHRGHPTLTQLIESHCNVYNESFLNKNASLDIICLVKIQQILIKSLILLLLS